MRVLSPVVVLLFLVTLLAGCTTPEPMHVPDEPPAFVTVDGRDYQLNQFLLEGARPEMNSRVAAGSEPAILVDKDDDYVWVGDTTGVYRSGDGGATWTRSIPLLGQGIAVRDGWDLAQDDTGTLYAVGLAEARLSVFRSFDKGTTWDLATTLADTVGGVPDRPWIDARGDGHVALIYNDFPTTRTRCMMSYDGGLTWPDQNPSSGTPISGSAVFDEVGDFYHTTKEGTVYRITRDDVTTQLGAPTQCLRANDSFDVTPGGQGVNHQLQVAAAGGHAYVAVADTSNRMTIAATDFTGFFPTTLVVSPPELRTNTFGTIAEQDGRLVVAWYGTETGGDPRNRNFAGSWNVYVAVVDDFWGTPQIQHFRVTDGPNHVGDICMDGLGCGAGYDRDLLDYFMVDIGPNGDIHVAYAHDGATSRVTSQYARIANP